MKITRIQLRRIIKESIAGHVYGDPEKEAYLDLTMSAISRGQYKKAANSIMDSYTIDDIFPEEEQALIDMLTDTPAGVSSREVEALADKWHQAWRAGTFAPQ